ncbi:MAG: VWA domain-containing protein [Myxococcota bacterium]
MNLDALHIAHPALAHGLWLWALVVVLLIALDRRGSGRLDRLVSARLADRLIARPAAWRRAARLALYALAGFAMVAALMRPQWGERFVATPRVGAEIMIALDVSRSMLADDARPSRLERAKAEISDLLAYLENDQVGLIAFAGRASILSPMTPDKSFLRLALDGAGPHSVSRGGTRLAEPILRAVAGLGEPGPAQRALILITDGEDHDSFALDAAKKAAEAGIKIITIGFGDEAGSPIFVRDPDSGARTQVRDAEGNPVISRLDGELLREIALATDGAYVPAGTGVLDLASIYDAHIARLTRGQLEARGRSIRGETYQGFVAVALAALVLGASAMAGGGSRRARAGGDRARSKVAQGARRSAVLLLCGVLLASGVSLPFSARAEEEEEVPNPSTASVPTEDAQAVPGAGTAAAVPAAAPADAAGEEDPRARFNRANAALEAGDPELASTLYREARRDAVDDHALRYAASYNLGMAAVAVADSLVASKPNEALARLHEAADWFREASAMRPEETDPRHNLDVTLRRALILADEIARKSERDLAGALDGLIEAQRARVGESASLLEALARESDPDAALALRPAFDAAATALREQMADAGALAERAADEKALLESKSEQARTPEDALRAAALEGVVAGIDAGVERMGQARRQLRGRSAERAYRRGAEALAALKRARDALRDPVEQIGVLIGEVAGIAQATAVLGGAENAARAGDAASQAVRIPAFLTPEAIGAESASVEARIGELASRFTTAAERAEQGAAEDPNAPGAEATDPAIAAKLRAALADAAPRIEAAHTTMGRATAGLAAKAFSPALEAERATLDALREAQERFFDLRELLAATHESEARIAAFASADDPEIAARREAAAEPLAAEQRRNRVRADRLETLLADERASALQALAAGDPAAAGSSAAPAPATPPPPADPARIEALEQRFARAGELLGEAAKAMDEAEAGFGGARAGGGAGRERAGRADWSQVAPAAARATAALDALRMLFSTLVEQLQRLEREQIDLADRTGEAIALAAAEAAPPARGPETRARVEALDGEQKSLEARAGAIADALVAESDRAAAAEQAEEAAGESAPAPPSGAPDAKTLRRAADHVATAQLAMQEASETFGDAQAPLDPASAAQGAARDALRKALELLQPPPPESPENPPPDDANQDDGAGGDSGGDGDESQDEGAGEPPPEPQPEAAEDESAGASEDPGAESAEGRDPAQLLQGVRDREAERRDANERRARERRRAAPVEKDW